MVREILKLYTDKGAGATDAPFYNIEITEYSYQSTRMGMPTLTATLMYEKCLDDEWTQKEYVIFRGERYYIRKTPTSSKSNKDERYKHEITFSSERDEILKNIYFYDTVTNKSTTKDKPCSNSTTVTFYGTIGEFIDRLNCAFVYAKVGDSILNKKTSLTTEDTPVGDGYCAMIDIGGILEPDKTYDFSFDDSYLWDAISNVFNKTEIPFEFRGKRIIFGAVPQIVDYDKFEYGHDNELLSIKKTNTNNKVINRITFKGSSENIPYYYPNETEYGSINVNATSSNSLLTTDKIKINNPSLLISNIREGMRVYRRRHTGLSVSLTNMYYKKGYDISTSDDDYKPLNTSQWITPDESRQEYAYNIKLECFANFPNIRGKGILNIINGETWVVNESSPARAYNLLASDFLKICGASNGVKYEMQDDDTILLSNIPSGAFDLYFEVTAGTRYPNGNGASTTHRMVLSKWRITGVELYASQRTYEYWECDGKEYSSLAKIGLAIDLNDAAVGDSFYWNSADKIPFQTNLMPPKYRNTRGDERFYNALNKPYSEPYALAHEDAYIDPDTKLPYKFPMPYIDGAPSEYVYKNEDIKPTIEGVRNDVKTLDEPDGQLFGQFLDIAYDDDDNDIAVKDESGSDSGKYEHSYFYVKIPRFSGAYGFDLFSCISQTDVMTLQMRSGNCNGCKFKVKAVEFVGEDGLNHYKNPVQTTGPDGTIVSGGFNDKINEHDFQDWQQDSMANSIWICLQKDVDTFGVIMPNASNNFKPSVGDKFNIINIYLPKQYITAAEKRGEQEMMRYMFDNNEEKFTFDISISRIFFAQRPDLLNQFDEYSKIRVKYNGRVYEQFVSTFAINCKNNEVLPEIRVDLSDTIAVGSSFIDGVTERAQSLIANAFTLGGSTGLGGSGAGGLTPQMADMRYLSKQRNERTPYKIATNKAFEVGDYVSGSKGGIFYIDHETGETYIEVDKLHVRLKAIFEELMISKVTSVAGEQIITPGGSIEITFVEEAYEEDGSLRGYKCYFKAKTDEQGADCKFQFGDYAKSQQFNISAGITTNASNNAYWRRVEEVNNTDGYVILSAESFENLNDKPQIGDIVCQLGNDGQDSSRQCAIIFSSVNDAAPSITLYDGVQTSLRDKEVIAYGVDKTDGKHEPFFNCYGRTFIGPKDGSSYIRFTPSLKKLEIKAKLEIGSTFGDKDLGDFINDAAEDAANGIKDDIQKSIDELQKQVDGVIESYSFPYTPTDQNYPANEWITDGQKEAHVGDVFFNIQPAFNEDGTPNPDAGKAWRWSPDDEEHSGYHWHPIADSDAIKALQLAQMSVTETDVLFKQDASDTIAPALPEFDIHGDVIDMKGWQSAAPTWQEGLFIWQTTKIKRGNNTISFSTPVCISGRDGVGIKSIVEEYNLSTSRDIANGTWSETRPKWEAGKYMWTRSKITYSDEKVVYVGEVCVTGNDGTSILVRYSSDNINFHPDYRDGDLWMQTSIDNGHSWSSSIKIVGENGKDGQYNRFQWVLSASATSLDDVKETEWQNSPMETPAGYYLWMRTGIVVPPSEKVYWQTPTRITGDKGKDGESVYVLDLTNEVAGIACDSKGNPIKTGTLASTSISVYKGSTDDTINWAFTIASQTDCVASIVDRTIYVSSILSESAKVVVEAKNPNVNLVLTSAFSLYMVKPGADGQKGDDGVTPKVYSIQPSVNSITRLPNKKLPISKISCRKYVTTGEEMATTTMHYLYAQVNSESATGGWVLIANKGTSLGQITITDESASVVFELRDSSSTTNYTVLDRERVPILTDAGDLEVGSRNLITNTFGNHDTNRWQQVVGNRLDSYHTEMTNTVDLVNGATYTLRCKTSGEWTNDFSGATAEGISNKVCLRINWPTGWTTAITDSNTDSIKGTTFVWTWPTVKARTCQICFSSFGKYQKFSEFMLVRGNSIASEWVSAPEDEVVGTRNLLLNSGRERSTFQNSVEYSNYAKDMYTTVELQQSQVYTIRAKSSGTFTSDGPYLEARNKGEASDLVRIVLFKLDNFNAGDNTVNITVSDDNTGTEKGTTFLMTQKTGVYFVRMDSISKSQTFSEFSLVKGSKIGTGWTVAPEETEQRIDGITDEIKAYDYIKQSLLDAKKETTSIEGGLILATLIKLGYTTDSSGYVIQSGINGKYSEDALGGGVAIWAGGDMIDRGILTSTSAKEKAAKTVIRHDGTGYLANENIKWDNNGDIEANKIKVQSGEIAGFEISGGFLTTRKIGPNGTSLDKSASIIVNYNVDNDNEKLYAGIGGGVMSPSVGLVAVGRFEHEIKANSDGTYDGLYGKNTAISVMAKGTKENIAIEMNGGAISGMAIKNSIIYGSMTSYDIDRSDYNIIALNSNTCTVKLPQMDTYDDGHVVRIKRLGSGIVRLYAQSCYTFDGSNYLTKFKSPPVIIYDQANYIIGGDHLDIASAGDAMEFVWVRDISITINGTKYYGAWVQYKFPRDW